HRVGGRQRCPCSRERNQKLAGAEDAESRDVRADVGDAEYAKNSRIRGRVHGNAFECDLVEAYKPLEHVDGSSTRGYTTGGRTASGALASCRVGGRTASGS